MNYPISVPTARKWQKCVQMSSLWCWLPHLSLALQSPKALSCSPKTRFKGCARTSYISPRNDLTHTPAQHRRLRQWGSDSSGCKTTVLRHSLPNLCKSQRAKNLVKSAWKIYPSGVSGCFWCLTLNALGLWSFKHDGVTLPGKPRAVIHTGEWSFKTPGPRPEEHFVALTFKRCARR